MKKLLFILGFSALQISTPTPINAQSVIVWEDTISVAEGSIYGYTRPRITLNRNNEPVVVFGKIGTGILHASKFNGNNFDTPIQVTPDNFQSYLSTWTGPEIDSNGDTILIVFKQAPIEQGHVYSVRSTDGGLTFSDTLRTDSHGEGVAWLPNLAVNNNGNPSVIYMAHDGVWSNPRYVVTHSTDAGVSFSTEQEIANTVPDEACDCCPAAYASKGNDHALLYRNNESNVRDLYAVTSNDGGASFPNYENIDQLFWSITSCPSTGPDAFIDQSNLFSVSASRASGKYRCYVNKKDLLSGTNSNEAFMLPEPENVNGIANYPRIHGTYDSLFVVWQASDNSNYEIYCAFGTANDFTLFEQTKCQVNINTTGTQLNPDLYYRDGFVHVVYRDGDSGNVMYRRGKLSNVGLSEYDKDNIKVFPNPCNDRLNTTGLNGVFKYTIYSISGSLVIENQLDTSSESIDVGNLNNGLYILEIKGMSIPFEKRNK
tara:strand:+ start:139 stop:1596 length:1458 start_codon:yes stop_codon:yes gene_type:complete